LPLKFILRKNDKMQSQLSTEKILVIRQDYSIVPQQRAMRGYEQAPHLMASHVKISVSNR